MWIFGPGVSTYGPELVTNGDFSAGTMGWTAIEGTIGAVSGEIEVTGSGGAYPSAASALFPVVVGKIYQYSATFRRGTTADNAGFVIQNNGSVNKTTTSSNTTTTNQRTTATFTASESGLFKATCYISSVTGVGTAYFDNISVKEVLSTTSQVINGLTTGNYADSAGTQLAVVDSVEGLVLDAMGSVGTSFGNPQVVNIAAFGVVNSTTTFVVGKSYWITLSADAGVTGGTQVEGYPSTAVSAGQSKTIFFAPTGTTVGLRNTAGGTVGTLTLRAQEITGRHLSQPTAGYKPKLRRGLVNLLLNSINQSASPWLPQSLAPIVANLLTPTVTTAPHNQLVNMVLPSGTTTICMELKPNGYTKFGFRENTTAGAHVTVDCSGVGSIIATNLSVAASIALMQNGSYMVVFTFVSAAVASNLGFYVLPQSYASGSPAAAAWAGDSVSGMYLNAAALFRGTYTAAQIQALGGIPLTTTAAASGSAGPYYGEFDGVDDALALPGPVFQMSDDHCVIAAATCTTAAANATIFQGAGNNAVGGTQARLGTLRFNAGRLSALWVNDAISVKEILYPTSDVGASVVASLVARSGVTSARRNGVQFGTSTTPTLPATVNSAFLGAAAQPGGVLAEKMSGNIRAVITIKGTVTDAELVLLEKLVAAIAGITI
jgi:hypothetical protein